VSIIPADMEAAQSFSKPSTPAGATSPEAAHALPWADRAFLKPD